MDGEGTITIKRYLRNKKLYYLPYISCAQVNKPLNLVALNRLKKIFGGSLARYIQKPNDGNRIDAITWNITSRKASDCIRRLLPYLVVKKPQGRVMIKFCNSCLPKKNCKPRIDDRGRKKREKYFELMRNLNVKGKLRLQRLNESAPKGDVKV